MMEWVKILLQLCTFFSIFEFIGRRVIENGVVIFTSQTTLIELICIAVLHINNVLVCVIFKIVFDKIEWMVKLMHGVTHFVIIVNEEKLPCLMQSSAAAA